MRETSNNEPFSASAWMKVAAAVNLLAVVSGAFGAHVLSDVITASDLEIFRTATLYQFLHGFAILGTTVAATSKILSFRTARLANCCFLCGIVFFSGSLYLLIVSDLRWLGAVTPLGGIAFIVGWLALVFGSGGTDEMQQS